MVTLSSAESEYVQITLACQEIINLREMLEELGQVQAPTAIMEDNQAAIAICHNPVHRQRTRHITRRYHWIRQCIRHGLVRVHYIPTDWNVADMFTKPLPTTQFERLRAILLNEDGAARFSDR